MKTSLSSWLVSVKLLAGKSDNHCLKHDKVYDQTLLAASEPK